METKDLLRLVDVNGRNQKELAVKDVQKEITKSQEYIKSYKRNIISYQNSLKEYEVRLAEAQAKLPAVEKTLAEHETDKSTQRHLEKLLNHPAVHHFDIVGETLYIYLKPLFTDVKVGDAERSRKRQRRFLGCFLIQINTKGYRYTQIWNKSYVGMEREHWSILHGNPCWGNWQTPVEQAFKAGHFDSVVTILVEYIRSTLDTGAYMSAKYWIETHRQQALTYRKSELMKLKEGEYYIFLDGRDKTDYNSISLLGLPILASRDEIITFLVPVKCRSLRSSSLPERDWCVERAKAVLITKEQAEEFVTKYKEKELIRSACLEYVKALPEEKDIKNLPEILDSLTQEEADGMYEKLIGMGSQTKI